MKTGPAVGKPFLGAMIQALFPRQLLARYLAWAILQIRDLVLKPGAFRWRYILFLRAKNVTQSARRRLLLRRVPDGIHVTLLSQLALTLSWFAVTHHLLIARQGSYPHEN